MIEVSPRRFVKGRKNHRCDECARWIRKGHESQVATWIIDGEGFHTCRLCLRCAKWEKVYFDTLCEEEWLPGSLMEFRRESLQAYLCERDRR